MINDSTVLHNFNNISTIVRTFASVLFVILHGMIKNHKNKTSILII